MPLFDELGIDIVFTAHLHTYRNRGHIKNFQRNSQGPLTVKCFLPDGQAIDEVKVTKE